jgi:hypothetical protein
MNTTMIKKTSAIHPPAKARSILAKINKEIDIHSTSNKSIITYKFNSNNELCKIINTDEKISYLEKSKDINYLFSKFNENKNNNCFKTKIKNEYIYITS